MLQYLGSKGHSGQSLGGIQKLEITVVIVFNQRM